MGEYALPVNVQAAVTVLGRLPAKEAVARADLQGAWLAQINLGGANLTGAHHLSQEQLNAANGNSKTWLPTGLQRPEHWLGEETSRPK